MRHSCEPPSAERPALPGASSPGGCASLLCATSPAGSALLQAFPTGPFRACGALLCGNADMLLMPIYPCSDRPARPSTCDGDAASQLQTAHITGDSPSAGLAPARFDGDLGGEALAPFRGDAACPLSPAAGLPLSGDGAPPSPPPPSSAALQCRRRPRFAPPPEAGWLPCRKPGEPSELDGEQGDSSSASVAERSTYVLSDGSSSDSRAEDPLQPLPAAAAGSLSSAEVGAAGSTCVRGRATPAAASAAAALGASPAASSGAALLDRERARSFAAAAGADSASRLPSGASAQASAPGSCDTATRHAAAACCAADAGQEATSAAGAACCGKGVLFPPHRGGGVAVLHPRKCLRIQLRRSAAASPCK